MELKKRSRRIRIENPIGIDDDVFIQVGLGPDHPTCPSFTLYGEEARAHVAKEQAAGRLLKPHNDGSSGLLVYLED